MLLSALLLPLGLSLGAAPAGAVPGPETPQVVNDCQHTTRTPTRVVAACADANSYALVRHYDSWTRHQARGRGVLVVNDCRPSCAEGTFRRYPATFGFRRVVTNADGVRVFTRLGVTYVRGGEPHNTTFALPSSPLI